MLACTVSHLQSILSDPLLLTPTASLPKESEEEFSRDCINIWRLYFQDSLYIKYYSIFTFRTVIEDWVRLGNIHVVHFENVLSNRVKELRRILNFLNIKIDQKRMSCVEFCENDMFKRPTDNQTSLQFTEIIKNEIEENILFVDQLLEKYGHDRIPLELYSK